MAKKNLSGDPLVECTIGNGMAVTVLSSTSLFGKTELAMTINGQIVSGVEVIEKKNGALEVKNVINGSTKITKEGEVEQSVSDPMDIG